MSQLVEAVVYPPCVTEDDAKQLLANLPGARVLVASAHNGAPEAAWGDTFCYHDPDGTEDQKWPFATIVTHDTSGWDEVSGLDRPGAFRLNLHVGRPHVPEATKDLDYSEADVVLPHPQYAAQGWIAIVNPARRAQVQELADIAQQRVSTDWPGYLPMPLRRRAGVRDIS